MKVRIEYCSKCQFEKQAKSLKEKLLQTSTAQVEQVDLVPFEDGRFEVIKDGQKVYSKLETGHLPEENQILNQLAA